MIFTTAGTSVMVRPMSDPELADLLVDNRARNSDRGITGLLLYRAGRVVQMLQGDDDVVRERATASETLTSVRVVGGSCAG